MFLRRRKMKNEPLKGKIIPEKEENFFREQDVKSAVEGLISDLEAERVGVFPDMECGYDIFYDDNGEFVRFEKVIELIKKWFPDVFEK